MVGQLTTVAPAPASNAMSPGVTWMPCTTLVRGPRKPVRSSSSIGVQPCSARHSSSSRTCSCAWTWRTSPCRSAYRPIASSQSAGTARTLCAATPTLTRSRSAAQDRSPSTRSRNASTLGSQNRRCPGSAQARGPRGGRPRAAARSPGRPRRRPRRARSPARWALRRVCRRAGGGRSGTRPRCRSPRPPSRRTRAPPPRASAPGRARLPGHTWSGASSRSRRRRTRGARRARAGRAGTRASARWPSPGPQPAASRQPLQRPRQRGGRLAASESSTCSDGAWLVPSALRTRTMPAGRCSATIPASCPAKHRRSGAPLGVWGGAPRAVLTTHRTRPPQCDFGSPRAPRVR